MLIKDDNIIKELSKCQEKRLFTDIIDVYKGVYTNYSFYLEINEYRKRQAEEYNSKIANEGYTVCVIEPIVLSEEQFNMIVSLRDKNKK